MKYLSRFLGLVLLFSIGTLLLGCTDLHQKPLALMADDLQPSSPREVLSRTVEPYPFEEPGIFPSAMLVDLQPSPALKLAGESRRLVEPQLLTESGEQPAAMLVDLQPSPVRLSVGESLQLVEPQLLNESGEPPAAMNIDLKPLTESRTAKKPKLLAEPQLSPQLVEQAGDESRAR